MGRVINKLVTKVRITKGFYDRLGDQVSRASISFGADGEEALEALRLRLHEAVDDAVDDARRFSDEDKTTTFPDYYSLVRFWLRHRCCGEEP